MVTFPRTGQREMTDDAPVAAANLLEPMPLALVLIAILFVAVVLGEYFWTRGNENALPIMRKVFTRDMVPALRRSGRP
jgi:hypothetical protein